MRILINITESERSYQGHLLQEFRSLGYKGAVTTKAYTIDRITQLAKARGVDAIFCTHPGTIQQCVPAKSGKINQDDWRGSVLKTSVPIVISNPLQHIRSKIIGKLLFQIDVRKLATTKNPKFLYDYSICHNEMDLRTTKADLQRKQVAILVIDIETSLRNQITSVAFTPILDDYTLGKTYTIPLLPKNYATIDEAVLAWEVVKALCENRASKVFHNGTFDCFHLLRYNIIPYNYLHDTEYLWRCWYAELDKALAKVCSYLLPDYYYWKHEADLNPLEYNAKDTINTARVFIEIIQKAPRWVWKNYTQMCPNIAPAIYCSFEGFKTDIDKRAEARKKAQADVDRIKQELAEYTGIEHFNPNSPKQVSTLIYKVLGAAKPKRAKSDAATGKIELDKVARQHPLFAIFTSRITKYKEENKAINTYYDALLDDKARLYYAYAIDGTETTRMACNSSSLRELKKGKETYVKTNMSNMGQQLQNIPIYLKKSMHADEGYLLIDIDKSQSEARCTAYLASCESLREALENPPETAGVRDFYCYTGYRFFGVEFNKEHILRQAVKKIIHGTNYVMGVDTFIDSIGLENLVEYKKLVKYRGNIKQFASYLLGLYHEAYPEVKQAWEATVQEVANTGKVITPDGWTRIVIGDITTNHNIKRSIIAHKSQHFSVVGINEAFWKLFYYVQVPSNGDYRLKGQIHDSIVSQARKEKAKEYAKIQAQYMDIPQATPFGELRIPLDTAISYYWKEGE